MTRYRTIVADPPWLLAGGPGMGGKEGSWSNTRSRPLPYPTMTANQIEKLPVFDLAEDASHLYLWTTNRYVEDAFLIARVWGFTPSTLLVWAKNAMGGGLGGAFGITTEYILFARRGSLPAKDRVTGTWFNWKRPYDDRGKPDHSRKPEAFLDLVEQVSPGPYLELFARRQRLGWDTWGDEALEHVRLTSCPGEEQGTTTPPVQPGYADAGR